MRSDRVEDRIDGTPGLADPDSSTLGDLASELVFRHDAPL
jgi:hypothetical protein